VIRLSHDKLIRVAEAIVEAQDMESWARATRNIDMRFAPVADQERIQKRSDELVVLACG